MLGLTLTDELQRHFCRSPRPPLSELSLHARCWMNTVLDYGDYERYSGLEWHSSTYEQRYATTAGLPHDAAVRAELDAFAAWVSDIYYLTVAQVRSVRYEQTGGSCWLWEEAMRYKGSLR